MAYILIDFIYLVRFPDEKDPEVTPSKLFRVERIKSTRHHPYWQKNILKEMNILDEVKKIRFSFPLIIFLCIFITC